MRYKLYKKPTLQILYERKITKNNKNLISISPVFNIDPYTPTCSKSQDTLPPDSDPNPVDQRKSHNPYCTS
jgi:hypothetical protein